MVLIDVLPKQQEISWKQFTCERFNCIIVKYAFAFITQINFYDK